MYVLQKCSKHSQENELGVSHGKKGLRMGGSKANLEMVSDAMTSIAWP